MDTPFHSRKTKKDKERRNRELYGNHSAKHVRIQEHCQENHLKNIQLEKDKNNKHVATSDKKGKNKK
jgi:hypothetical protein